MEMNREIKFQVLHKNEIFGEEKLTKDGWVSQCYELNPDKGVRWDKMVFTGKDFIRRQFTGLKDLNGKEIYDGDILDSGGEDGYLGELVFVTFNEDELAWVVSTKDYDFRDRLRSCFADKSIVWEIIGNIYQNHKLLKK